jgi:hypothetical protein
MGHMHASVKIFHLYGIKRGSCSYNRKGSVEKPDVRRIWTDNIKIYFEDIYSVVGVDWGKLRA